MNFDWSDYLELAQDLMSNSARSSFKEAHLRAAISRAYYAAFCKARNLLIDRDRYIPPKDRSVHTDVISMFEYSSDETRRSVGFMLHDLRNSRNIVDYENIFDGNIMGRTKAALSEASEVLRLLSSL